MSEEKNEEKDEKKEKKEKKNKKEKKKEKKEKREKEKKEKESSSNEDKDSDKDSEKKEKKNKDKDKDKDKEATGEGKTYNINDIAERAEVNAREVRSFFDTMKRRLEKMKVGSQVRIQGICSFIKVETKPRKSRNPRTGASVEVPAKKKIKIRISNNLKNL